MPLKALKCPACGAELQVQPDAATCVCSYCDSTVTIPKNLERKEALYNRAVFQRQSDEFDKAVATYEELLREDNEDADAHWGLLLSKYGIEYVKDPRSGAQVPTFNRTMAQSILADVDYKAALEYAPMDARAVYEAEGKRLNDIQSHILQISRQEPPYEIFICYKETDSAGARTKDSVIAQDLYGELEKKGYKVFFARKTLEGKLGGEYEPIIYAALSSAPVMVVVGTTPQNFEAPWVRNEWSRFMRMGKAGEKTIIPAYRDMAAYELPAELSNYQAQDMSKLGFMQDLVDGVERFLRHSHGAASAPTEAKLSASGAMALERLLQNAETYIRLRDYNKANEVYDDVIKNYPEDYRGWWGKCVCATKSPMKFLNSSENIKVFQKNYSYAKELAPENAVRSLQADYLEHVLDAAQALYAAEKLDLADFLYGLLQKDYEGDYRVWWGSILCRSCGLTVSADKSLSGLELETLNGLYMNASKAAPENERSTLETEYLAYLQGISEVNAKKEMQGLDGLQKRLANKKAEMDANLDKKKQSIERKKQDYRQANQDLAKRISDLESELARKTKILAHVKLRRKILAFSLLWIAMTVAFVVYSASHPFPELVLNAFLAGLLICLPASMMILWFDYGKGKQYKEYENDVLIKLPQVIANCKESQSMQAGEYQNGMQQLKDQSNAMNDEENQFQALTKEFLKLYHAYSELSLPQRASYWFEKLCAKVCIERPCSAEVASARTELEQVVVSLSNITKPAAPAEGKLEKQVKDLQRTELEKDALFAAVEDSIPKDATLTCPVCGASLNKQQLKDGRECPVCHYRFDV